jgi:hypothetical protein
MNVTSDDHVVNFVSDKPFVLVDTGEMGLDEKYEVS